MKMLMPAILLSFIVIGCGTQRGAQSNRTGSYTEQALGKAVEQRTQSSSGFFMDAPAIERKVSYSADISLETENKDTTLNRLRQIATSSDGYIVEANNAYITFRIPAAKLENTVALINTMGKITAKNIYGKDVTDEYYDVETRLANADSARKRYLELLAKAENVEAALKVEKELERLNGEIESFKGRLSRLKEITALATITVRFENPTSPGPLGYVFVYLYKGIKWLFVWN